MDKQMPLPACTIPSMRRLAILLVLTAALAAPTLHAQSASAPAAAAVACPFTATLDQLIAAIDAAVSGPANQDRTCFRALFLPDARLIPIRIAADGTATPRILTTQDWIDAVAKRGSAMVTEHQLTFKAETWAHMAHLWSTYETRLSDDPKAGDRGINSIQAIFDGKQWHVIEIVWQAEKPDDPVPAKYLP
jgi:hypothetical protein